jgi:nucleoid DNA-binding protein
MDMDSHKTINISDLVQEIMDAPFAGAETPIVHQRAVESQKAFASIIFEAILKKARDGETVRIKNFGAFGLRLAKPEARNPQTGAVVPVQNRKRLQFSPTTKAHKIMNLGENDG